jgi:hypothetical protein
MEDHLFVTSAGVLLTRKNLMMLANNLSKFSVKQSTAEN